MMNPNTFSILGYLSVLLWLAIPVLWFLRKRIRIPGWLPLVLAFSSFCFASINSRTHVSRIDIQISEAELNPLNIAAEKRKALEAARGENVADIRFAEDGDDDFIDKGGMDEAEKKYLEHLENNQDPAWKKNKKERGETDLESNDIDDLIDTEEPSKKLSAAALPEEEETRSPILMPEKQVMTARRLNRLNIDATYIAILLGISYLLVDYLSRANSYARASYPVPLPAALRSAFLPLPAIVSRPEKPRRTLPEELVHLARRGDVFLCFTKDRASLPDKLPSVGKDLTSIEVLSADNKLITPDFIFESLWYSRACFHADAAQVKTLIPALLEMLTLRKVSRARAKQNIHLVWNLNEAPDDKIIAAFDQLGPSTGFSLFIAKE